MKDVAAPGEILAELEKVVVGQRENLRLAMATILTGGHLLLEDRPGVGKTTFAKSLGNLFGVSLSRVQGTPDLLPTDITGVHIFDPDNRRWDFREGPIFSSLVLVDELNRATAKAQSALLEAMSERQVTVDGETMLLPNPFTVIATQNPIGEVGTHRLSAAQLDRFAAQISFGLPSPEAERAVIVGQAGVGHADSIAAIASPEQLPDLFAAATAATVSEDMVDYVLAVVNALRGLSSEVWLSVRVSETLLRVARGVAFMNDRSYVAPEDVQTAAFPVVRHRMPRSLSDDQVRRAIEELPVPVRAAS